MDELLARVAHIFTLSNPFTCEESLAAMRDAWATLEPSLPDVKYKAEASRQLASAKGLVSLAVTCAALSRYQTWLEGYAAGHAANSELVN